MLLAKIAYRSYPGGTGLVVIDYQKSIGVDLIVKWVKRVHRQLIQIVVQARL